MDERTARFRESWETLLKKLSGAMSRGAFEGLIQNARPREVVGGEVLIEVMNEFARERIISSHKELLEKAVREILQDDSLEVRLVSAENGENEEGSEENRSTIVVHEGASGTEEDYSRPRTGLNERYTFDSFVVGKTNELAHSYSRAVAENPGVRYNPLFLYGGVGVGKTHLMQAIGHYVIDNNPKKKTIYVSSEGFLNDLIMSIGEKKEREFRARYRTADVFIVDDIQFIAGKERTQEEFFHTFNELFQRNKQIVLSSDRKPHEIPNLEARLVSRFESGLVADIQPPDLELRMAIVRKLAIENNVNISTEVITYIAEKITSNIRQLVGTFINVIAFASVHKRKITLELAEEVLKEMQAKKRKKITVEAIQEAVAEYFHIKVADLKSPRRSQAIAYPRQIAMYLSRTLAGETTTAIGEKFGGRDHTTVLHAESKVEQEIANKTGIEEVIKEITRRIENM